MSMIDKAVQTVKKHKVIAMGAGALLLLHVMRRASASGSAVKQMPIGPTRTELTAISGPLGSL